MNVFLGVLVLYVLVLGFVELSHKLRRLTSRIIERCRT